MDLGLSARSRHQRKGRSLSPRYGHRLRCHDAPYAGQWPAGSDVHSPGCRRLGRSRRNPLGRGTSGHSAWNIVTETESALKEGNYVQGTVCLVLRKRLSESNARRMEIEAEIEEAVAAQLARLTALDDIGMNAPMRRPSTPTVISRSRPMPPRCRWSHPIRPSIANRSTATSTASSTRASAP